MRKIRTLGVDWYLLGKKKPFANTTTSTRDLIECLAEIYDGDLREILIHLTIDEEAKFLVSKLLEKGIRNYYEEITPKNIAKKIDNGHKKRYNANI